MEELKKHYFAGPIYKFDLIIDSIVEGSIPRDKLKEYELTNVPFDQLVSMGPKDFMELDLFTELRNRYEIGEAFTLREYIYIQRNQINSSRSKPMMKKLQEMALLGGRSPASIINVCKEIKAFGGDLTKFVKSKLNSIKSENGKLFKYSHA